MVLKECVVTNCMRCLCVDELIAGGHVEANFYSWVVSIVLHINLSSIDAFECVCVVPAYVCSLYMCVCACMSCSICMHVCNISSWLFYAAYIFVELCVVTRCSNCVEMLSIKQPIEQTFNGEVRQGEEYHHVK